MAGIAPTRTPLLREHNALPPEEIIFGCTTPMLVIRNQLKKVCVTNVPILIQGSGGSGKEILARWIHRKSPWSAGPFVKVNFAAIPGNILESELFGYRAGAFTGANSDRIGRVELAQGGTLFLDQITDLGSSFQAKLLQLLQDGRFTRLGDHEERRVEARIICASSWRLEDAVREGHFRQDLYYRLNVFEIVLPPLSARREDIPSIANYLLCQLNTRYQREASKLSTNILRLLQTLEWRGNIREMENWISRYVLLGEEDLPTDAVGDSHLQPLSGGDVTRGSIPLKRIARQARQSMNRELILSALNANRWNRRKAAKDLKISYRSLLYKIREAGLCSRLSRDEQQPKESEGPNSTLPAE
jgi:two-component system, NtrC family, response regulator AtoC